MKKFIMTLEGLNDDATKKLVNLFRENNLGFWHHVGDLWLITALDNSTINCVWLRDKSAEVTGINSCFVSEVHGVNLDWAVRANKESHEWLHKNWK